MSSATFGKSDPAWFQDLFLSPPPQLEGGASSIAGRNFVRENGLVREQKLVSSAQKQTEETFGFKWKKRDTFESATSLARMREWLLERYGDVAKATWLADGVTVLDAGCGAGMSGLELFRQTLPRIHYVGADISEAVDVASQRFHEAG